MPARAQLPGRAYRIAYFGFTATNSADDDRTVAAFVDRLAELGFVQGRDLRIEWRYAEGKNERYAEFARDYLVRGLKTGLFDDDPVPMATP